MNTNALDPVREAAQSTLEASLEVVDEAQHTIDQMHRSGRRRRRQLRLMVVIALIGIGAAVVIRQRRMASQQHEVEIEIGDAVTDDVAPQPGAGTSDSTVSDRTPAGVNGSGDRVD